MSIGLYGVEIEVIAVGTFIEGLTREHEVELEISSRSAPVPARLITLVLEYANSPKNDSFEVAQQEEPQT